MKTTLKQTFMTVTLSATLFIGSYAVHAAPQWYTNYLNGISTSAGSDATQDLSQKEPSTATPTYTVPSTGSSSALSTNEYWRSKYSSGGSIPSTPESKPTTPSVPTQPETDPVDQTVSGVSQEEAVLFGLLNDERRARGLTSLKMNSQLTQLARLKAKDMAVNNYFSHTSPTYGKAADMVRAAGIAHWIVGENIAHTSSAERANDLFMGSSVHRNTMLSKNYTEVGIGMYRKANGTLYIAEIFIGTR